MPYREKEEEWIANNIFDFHKQICMLFATIKQYCTKETCPQMTAINLEKGIHFIYMWSVDEFKNTSIKLSASEHILHTLDWVEEQLEDESLFPSRSDDSTFPANFKEVARTICKRLFRIYAHIYHHHLQQVKYLKEEAHFNTNLKHYIYFIKEFDLIEEKELRALSEFVEIHTKHPSATFESKVVT